MTAQWQPGKLYAPGDIVQPRITDAISQSALDNADFEGAGGWDETGNYSISAGGAFKGSQKMTFAAGTIMAIGKRNVDNLAKSSDGVNWALSEVEVSGSPVWFQNVAMILQKVNSLGKWFIAGGSPSPSAFMHVSSDNGASWTRITPTGDFPANNSNQFFKWFSELGLMFWGTASTEGIFRSSDGVAWVEGTQALSESFGNIDYSPTLGMLMVTSSATTNCLWSTDGGDTWTVTNTGLTVAEIIWCSGLGDAGLWVVFSSAGATKISEDGITWTDQGSAPSGYSGTSRSTAYDPAQNRLVAIDASSAGFTDDGINWTDSTTIPSGLWTRIVWDAGSGLFVVSENQVNNGSFMTSPDAVTWTEHTITAGSEGWATIASGAASASNETSENTARLTVEPGQQITAKVYAKIIGAGFTANVGITWHGAADALLGTTFGADPIVGASTAYRRVAVSGLAPDGALTCSVVLVADGIGDAIFFDEVTIGHANPVGISLLLFKATQADPGFSDSFEPTWPTVVGNTVVDNEVTWEGVPANRVQWQAFPILVSGSSEPTFPATVGGEVADNTISWKAATRRVEDPNCPNTAAVAITASKIFAGDKDIIPFSATVNPLDWTTANDAGYIPFGLNTYGSQDVSALGLYRSNLVAFNSKGFQMWQVDEDPTNFAILDAVPVGIPSAGAMSIQPVMNDLVFMVEVGIRSMGIAGASSNLAAGQFGKSIDPLVKAKLKAGEVPISLFYPGQGQYWLIFGAEAFVLTMNGGKGEMSWSRYTFPAAIDDWTILDKDLLLRSGDKILRLDEAAIRDEQVGDPATAGELFTGQIWWHYLDFGGLGDDKMMLGFDLVGEGEVTVTFGYNQKDTSQATPDYTLADINSVPGTMIPMPLTAPSIQMRLVFSSDQEWEWSAAAIYLQDQRTGS
jgi:hypothetical protein